MALILIIDDSAFTRNKMRKVAAEAGHEIIEASDGAQGLQTLYNRHPDCVILDLIMPEIDGLKILRAVREKGIGIPVLVVTADIQDSVRRQCMDLGATAFLNKPVNEDELRSTIKKVLPGERR
jgi:twitching motility two-component system response regulator PilH